MAVLKSPKNQNSKRTWIRLFFYRTNYLKFISRKAYYNKNFSTIPLKWYSVYTYYPLNPFDSPLENTYFSSYAYPYLLLLKKIPLKSSRFFITSSKIYPWNRLIYKSKDKPKNLLKVTDKKIKWTTIPSIS